MLHLCQAHLILFSLKSIESGGWFFLPKCLLNIVLKTYNNNRVTFIVIAVQVFVDESATYDAERLMVLMKLQAIRRALELTSCLAQDRVVCLPRRQLLEYYRIHDRLTLHWALVSKATAPRINRVMHSILNNICELGNDYMVSTTSWRAFWCQVVSAIHAILILFKLISIGTPDVLVLNVLDAHGKVLLELVVATPLTIIWIGGAMQNRARRVLQQKGANLSIITRVASTIPEELTLRRVLIINELAE